MKLKQAFKRNTEDNLMKRKITKILLVTKLFSKKNKVTKEQRDENREKRNELQLIIARSRTIRFNYICCHERPSKICFGSTLLRKCIPNQPRYMNSYMRKILPAPGKRPGPGTYNFDRSFVKNYPNKSGYTLLASKVSRMPDPDPQKVPGVGSYNIVKQIPVQKSKAPFGISAVKEKDKSLSTPGPGSYKFFKKTIQVEESFGKQRYVPPPVKMICTPKNYSMCKICSEVPLGDYWHNFQTNEDMCRRCMTQKMNKIKTTVTAKLLEKERMLNELKTFEKARYCDFYHKHDGTRAAVPVINKKVYKKKINKERYFAMYGM